MPRHIEPADQLLVIIVRYQEFGDVSDPKTRSHDTQKNIKYTNNERNPVIFLTRIVSLAHWRTAFNKHLSKTMFEQLK